MRWSAHPYWPGEIDLARGLYHRSGLTSQIFSQLYLCVHPAPKVLFICGNYNLRGVKNQFILTGDQVQEDQQKNGNPQTYSQVQRSIISPRQGGASLLKTVQADHRCANSTSPQYCRKQAESFLEAWENDQQSPGYCCTSKDTHPLPTPLLITPFEG